MSPNFTSCSSFLDSYLDPASSTLLAPLALYIIFTSASILILLSSLLCILRIERSSPLLVFLSPLIFIISPHRSCSLNTIFLCTIVFLPLLPPSFSIFIISSCPHRFELCLSRSVCILPHYSSLLALYLNPVPSSSFFSCFEENDYYDFFRLRFLSFLIFIIYLHYPYFFKVCFFFFENYFHWFCLFHYFLFFSFFLNLLLDFYYTCMSIIYYVPIFSIPYIYFFFFIKHLCF